MKERVGSPRGESPSDPNVEISIVIPVMNESDNVEPLTRRIVATVLDLQVKYEIVFVDDGSTDDTWARIRQMVVDRPEIKGISLSRNFGHQNALYAGLEHATGDAIVSLDGDLQHPPELIRNLYARWCEGAAIVKTVRSYGSDESALKRITSKWFYRAFSRLSGLPVQHASSDFRLLDRSVVHAIGRMDDPELFLRGMVDWVGYQTATVEYEADERQAGESKYNLRRMLGFATSAVVSFSSIPLKIALWIGVLTSGISFGMIGYGIVQYFRGETVAGWASLLTFTALMFGILFILLGIFGVYLSSVLEGVKRRPRYIVQDGVNLDPTELSADHTSTSSQTMWTNT